MKGLKTLITMQKRDIDELKKRQGLLYERREALMKRDQMLVEELETEMRLSEELGELRGFFGNFSDHVKHKRLLVAQEVVRVDAKIEEFTELIAIAFGELKKFEIALELHMEREKKKREKAENELMDEIAARKYREKRLQEE